METRDYCDSKVWTSIPCAHQSCASIVSHSAISSSHRSHIACSYKLRLFVNFHVRFYFNCVQNSNLYVQTYVNTRKCAHIASDTTFGDNYFGLTAPICPVCASRWCNTYRAERILGKGGRNSPVMRRRGFRTWLRQVPRNWAKKLQRNLQRYLRA